MLLARSNPRQSYKDHLTGVIFRCEEFLSKIRRDICIDLWPTLEQITLLAAEYHDLGKLHPFCQRILKKEMGGPMPIHTDAGVAHLATLNHWAADVSAQLIAGHHIGLGGHVPAAELRINDYVRERSASYPSNETTREFVDESLCDMHALHRREIPLTDYHLNALTRPSDIEAIRQVAFHILVKSDHADAAFS